MPDLLTVSGHPQTRKLFKLAMWYITLEFCMQSQNNILLILHTNIYRRNMAQVRTEMVCSIIGK